MYTKNRLLTLVEQKHVPLGIQLFTVSPAIIEVLGQTGYDFVIIDTEHSPANVRALEELIRTAELAGLIPYVRITSLHNEVEIRRALEAGAEGLFLPRVNSVEDIKRIADSAFIPPKGRRRICPATRAANYNTPGLDQYAEWNNAEIALIPIIETDGALESDIIRRLPKTLIGASNGMPGSIPTCCRLSAWIGFRRHRYGSSAVHHERRI